jgi:transposase
MRNGCILCGGVGSGKSRTSLMYYFKLYGGFYEDGIFHEMQCPVDLYIITTARKRDTREWESEMVPFLLSTSEKECAYPIKVVVDSWNNIAKYQNVNQSFFIFDEQRAIGKGPWSKAFIRIAQKNEWILLSATPGDSWIEYAPVFIANGYYRNFTDFRRQHVIYSQFTRYPKIAGYINEEKLQRLKSQILIPMEFERNTVSHHIDIVCDYDKALYRKVAKSRWDPFKEEPVRDAGALCYVFRKIVNSDISRIENVLEIVKKHSKSIIFYNFNYELDMLREALSGKRYDLAEWNGQKHEPLPNSDRWVYLVQYAAGAEGWNCTTTDTIIFFSQNYSYKVMIQAEGRINRMNTPFEELNYFHLKSYAPIDTAISSALHKKKNFNENKYIKW